MQKELFKALAFLGLIATVTILGCTYQTKPVKNLDQFEQISIVEEGMIDGYYYKLIKDKKTGRRILYYKDAMVVLPEKDQ